MTCNLPVSSRDEKLWHVRYTTLKIQPLCQGNILKKSLLVANSMEPTAAQITQHLGSLVNNLRRIWRLLWPIKLQSPHSRGGAE